MDKTYTNLFDHKLNIIFILIVALSINAKFKIININCTKINNSINTFAGNNSYHLQYKNKNK